ncbi:MAG: peptidoglycan editing factor PgeF [Bacteroidia bacterium]
MIDAPNIFSLFPNLIAAQSKRFGGVSEGDFNSLNLGLNTEDLEQHVEQNRKLFFTSLGIEESNLASSYQVHGTEILIANEAQRATGYDAVITNKLNLFVAVTIADCTPVLIYDKHTHALAAIHAGWRGTTAKIVERTLNEMQKNFGTNAADCFAYIGTCISKSAFEVGNEVAERFDNEFVHFNETKQKHYVDLKAANLQQLQQFGIPSSQIEIAETCTVLNNESYFSYRKENGKTGRMLAVIGRKE